MHGQFTWYELMTTDTAAAKTFYGSVVGWGIRQPESAPIPYTLFTTSNDVPAAGMMDLPADAAAMNIPPNWLGYVEVNDVDASTARAVSLGGTVHCQPRDIPDVGRFSCIADPQGAVIGLFAWSGEHPAFEQFAMGNTGWHELATSDPEAGLAFYADLLGWQKADAMPMGEMGVYQMFSTGSGPAGGILARPPGMPVSAWLYYINVPEAAAAAARITAGGGSVMNGPMEVPGGMWVAQCRDPQGAVFGILAPKP